MTPLYESGHVEFERYLIEDEDGLERLMTEIESRFKLAGRLDTYAFQGVEFDIGDTVVWNRDDHGAWSLDILESES